MQDNSDLRNLVLKSLDSKGILSHLKAQVRSSIYNVFHCFFIKYLYKTRFWKAKRNRLKKKPDSEYKIPLV